MFYLLRPLCLSLFSAKYFVYRYLEMRAWLVTPILFNNKRHPMEMDASHIQAFLTDLAVVRHVAASTQNQALKSSYWLLVLGS
jgi:hypothetical protein